MTCPKLFHWFRITAGILLGIVILIFLFLCIYPIQTDTLVSHSRPSKNFAESLERILRLKETDPRELNPAGQSILMHHGQRTAKVIVFFHGFTNSPRQFKELAEKFYALGYNVFIPRIPYHGLEISRSSELSRLTAEDLISLSDEAVDIAQGLGESVTVAGLSMGGIMTGWAAQYRQDIDLAVLVAPNFGTKRFPNFFLKPSINYLLMTSNHFIWWDSQLKSKLKRPQTAYLGFYSRALGEIRRLGWAVQFTSKKFRPKASSVLVITNANDQAVSKQGTAVIVGNWRKHDIAQVRTYEFPKELGLIHDLIDPQQEEQNIAIAYPTIISLITEKNQ